MTFPPDRIEVGMSRVTPWCRSATSVTQHIHEPRGTPHEESRVRELRMGGWLRGAQTPSAEWCKGTNRWTGTRLRPSTMLDTALRIGLVAVLVYACGRIVLPFAGILIWSAILAVMLYPLHLRLAARLGDRWSAC